ncbi:MAG: response regulator transcription factor [Nitrospirota bacterium]
MSISVVLADDHAVVRDGLKLLLEGQRDITVVGLASNGREAVKLVQKLSPDVAVLDIAMPELNGIEAALRIREASPRTRTIMLSMHATSEHVFRSLQAGAAGYLLKESAGSEVVKAVRAVHAGRRYLSEKIGDAGSVAGGPALSRARSPLERLSEREREVLQLVVEGRSSAEIASAINLSPKTVETYRSRIMQKLDVHDVAGLVKFALQHGVTGEE